MDESIFHWFNAWNATSGTWSSILTFMNMNQIKIAPTMLCLWSLWFLADNDRERTHTREGLVAVILTSAVVIGVSRALANYLPFSLRPLHTPGLSFVGDDGPETALDGWSSMPSDHASFVLSLALGIFFLHRRFGLFLILWCIFVVSIPRIVTALHWPSDIVVGWLVGALVTIVAFKPIRWFVRKTQIVPFFERREAIGYPLLFFATYEITMMFQMTRFIATAIIE